MIHETTVRVRYGEVDRMGVVYHANYLPYFEVGRTEFLRSLGTTYRAVEEGGLLLVVADAGLRYIRPAAYDDVLRVRTRLTDVSGVRLRFEYEVDRPIDSTVVATGHTTLASTDPQGRPIRMPTEMRMALEKFVMIPNSGPFAGSSGGKNEPRASVR